MAINLDMNNFTGDANTLGQGGGDTPKPGKGMVLITEWNEYGGANGKAHELKFEIVAWSDPDSLTMEWRQNIFHTDTTGKGHPLKCMLALGIAGGLFTAADVDEWKRTKAMPTRDYSRLIDRPIMLVLAEEADNNNAAKKWLRVPYSSTFFHCRDPRVSDWPKNQNMLNAKAALIGEYKPAGSAPAATASAAVSSPAPSNPFGNA